MRIHTLSQEHRENKPPSVTGLLLGAPSRQVVFFARTAFAGAVLGTMALAGQVVHAQAQLGANPAYKAAFDNAQLNYADPSSALPQSKNPGADLNTAADGLKAVQVLYKGATPAVQGAIDGTMSAAQKTLKHYTDDIISSNNCPQAQLSATAGALANGVAEVVAAQTCLAGIKVSTGQKIVQSGQFRALERQATFGFHGRANQKVMAGAYDKIYAPRIGKIAEDVDGLVPQADLAAEIAREKATSQPAAAPASPAAAQSPQQ